MTRDGNVLPEMSGITEAEFHAAKVTGLARAAKKVGDKALAFVMDLTTKQLGNIFNGGSTHPKRLWDALSADPTALDEINAKYGLRFAPLDATVIADRGTARLALLLSKVAAGEAPDSPGGTKLIMTELLGMEAEMRDARSWLQSSIDRIDAYRAECVR